MGILSHETERLIEVKASSLGETPDALVRRLLEDAPQPRRKATAIMEIARRSAALPIIDGRDWRMIRDEAWGE